MKIRNRMLTLAGVLLVAGATLAAAAPQGPGRGQGPGNGPVPGDRPCDGSGPHGFHGRGFGPGGEPGRMMGGMGPMGPLGFALHRLDLTAEQRDRIHDLFSAQRDADRPLRDKMRALRDQRMKEPMPTTFDEAGVRARAEERAKVMVEMQVAHARLASQVLGVLTPEQRDELQKMRDERRERFEERWGLDDEDSGD